MRRLLLAAVLIVAPIALREASAGDQATTRVFDGPKVTRTAAKTTPLDKLVQSAQRRAGVTRARPCSDAVFIRRVYIDVIGTLPTPDEVRAFLDDGRSDRRARLIEALMKRDEFADYWSLKWCDVLRVKSEFPINLWPNAVQAYHRWVREAVRQNLPYDVFARDLLTSSGSNFREPAVNFYRATRGRDPAALASAAALTFMGSRIDEWPEDMRDGMSSFFARVRFKRTREWKEEVVYSDPAPFGSTRGGLPDGTEIRIPAESDPRRLFADWLITDENPWFARVAVNRVWAWLLGRGLVHEPDDFRADNPAALPKVLDYLAAQLVASGWDLRHVMRLILASDTYQQSAIPRDSAPEATTLFAYYPVRRLDAEILIDALCWIGGTGPSYSSRIPEPYTFVPEEDRTIALSDGSITSPFLELFGRPARDSGLASERSNSPTADQRLYLLNSTEVRRRIDQSPRLRRIYSETTRDLPQLIRRVYLTLLSRFPTDGEDEIARAYFVQGGRNRRAAAQDLAWSLINTKEFLYRH